MRFNSFIGLNILLSTKLYFNPPAPRPGYYFYFEGGLQKADAHEIYQGKR